MTRTKIAVLALATAGTLAFPAFDHNPPTPSPASGGMPTGPVAIAHALTLEGANRAIAASMALARERGAGGAIAVVDAGGSLIALQRIDGTFAAGAEVSIGKARTAAMFKKPTKAFEDSINGGRTALAAVPQMTPLQGGIPIMHEGHVVGGIGVSGAHSQAEDEEIAMAGAAAIASTPPLGH
jgi:glc operon protein GlcG